MSAALPVEFLEPECPRCLVPVTVTQQQAGRSAMVQRVGVFHARCLRIWLRRLEQAIREACADYREAA